VEAGKGGSQGLSFPDSKRGAFKSRTRPTSIFGSVKDSQCKDGDGGSGGDANCDTALLPTNEVTKETKLSHTSTHPSALGSTPDLAISRTGSCMRTGSHPVPHRLLFSHPILCICRLCRPGIISTIVPRALLLHPDASLSMSVQTTGTSLPKSLVRENSWVAPLDFSVKSSASFQRLVSIATALEWALSSLLGPEAPAALVVLLLFYLLHVGRREAWLGFSR